MSDEKAILVLHGISMSGASMLRTLGPLGGRLEELGFTLVAPNASHRMSDDELTSLGTWLDGCYRKLGQDASDSFCDGRFWDPGEYYDWFCSKTNSESGKKTYEALEKSLDSVAEAIRGKSVVGVLGFSQGAAMAIVLLARAARGDDRFRGLGWSVFMSGFMPSFDEPEAIPYPIVGPLRGLFVIGENDPIFPGTREHLTALSRAFEGADCELVLVPALGHDIPKSPEVIESIARFVTAR